jgi:hypothetical protein
MSLYKFSPIMSEATLIEAVHYIIDRETLLSSKAVNKVLSITYLTIFAHYTDEYDELIKIIEKLGDTSDANNGTKSKLHTPIKAGDQEIRELRVRRPDPYRMQVGCCDFGIEDYNAFKDSHLENNKNLRLIERPDYEMIEFFDPDLDVLAYIVSP